MLQNADDAEAQRFRLDVLPGWPNAVNPLLRGPGLLVANDGFFRKLKAHKQLPALRDALAALQAKHAGPKLDESAIAA